MSDEISIANRALSAIGTRTTIASLTENSPEARQCSIFLEEIRDELLRLAPWDCGKNTNTLSLICAAPGTPENPTQGTTTWQKGQPPPPWSYEYAYPTDCLRALWIVPQFTTGFASGVPITTAITGGAPQYWSGPPVRFAIGIDQIGPGGVPAVTGSDARVILTNQENAILTYIKRVTDPNVMDDNFVQAWVAGLAGRICIPLTGDKALANMKIGEANSYVATARQVDGNEGLTINDVTPDWVRVRGIDFPSDFSWSPNIQFDWGNLLTMY
jgi:hypothetical protein